MCRGITARERKRERAGVGEREQDGKRGRKQEAEEGMVGSFATQVWGSTYPAAVHQRGSGRVGMGGQVSERAGLFREEG